MRHRKQKVKWQVNPTLSILTLNGNGLDMPIKRWRFQNELKKNVMQLCHIYKRPTFELKKQVKRKRIEKI